MEINKIKEINNVYDTINYALIDIEKEIEPFELYLNNQNIAYEIESKDVIKKKLKIILIKIKKLSNKVKQFEKDVIIDKEIKHIFYPKAKILLQKYTGILKRILIVNDKFENLQKNENISKNHYLNSTNNDEINIEFSEEKNISQQQKTLQMGNQDVINKYTETQERNNEIKKIAIEIKELYEIFQDFTFLVEEQHEQILSIDNNIQEAQTIVKKGNNNLILAIEKQKKTRKIYCCCAFLFIIILIIIFSLIGGLSSKL